MPFNYAQLERRIASLEANRGASLRFGTVTEVNPDTGSARVQLEDGDKMVTWPLRVLQPRSLKDKRQVMPDLGEPVAVLFAGQGLEQGVVLGAQYSTKTPPPAKPASHDYMAYEDGTEIWYDREAHKLVAKVKGDAEIETDGHITAHAQKGILAESAVNITLRAPTITLAGLLKVTDKDGRPGSGELLGTYKVRQGHLHVTDGDTTAGGYIKAGMDVLAGTISGRHHLHGGVKPGLGTTQQPSGSAPSVPDISVPFPVPPLPPLPGDEADESLRELGERLEKLTDKDRLLLCLPRIADAEATRAGNVADTEGWLYLRRMFIKWLTSPANNDPKACDAPFWVEWDWVMRYTRAFSSYEYFTNKINELLPHCISNNASQIELAKILSRNGMFSTKAEPFDYTQLSPELWQQWLPHAFNYISVPGQLWPVDGMTAALRGFTLRALAKGIVESRAGGGHTVTVTGVSVFAYDEFQFNGENESYGYWSCENRAFSYRQLQNIQRLSNTNFHDFRTHHGMGGDFVVLSNKHNVENFQEISYVWV